MTPPTGVTDPNRGDNTAIDTDSMDLIADLVITKSDNTASVTPGATVAYTIVAANVGPSDVVGADVIDLLPALVLGATWTCSGSGGGACAAASGSGAINQLVDLPAGAAVTFSLSGLVDPSLATDLVNTASITAPVDVTDPNSTNNSATDIDSSSPVSDLGVTKTDGLITTLPGDVVTYTVAVSNAGPSDAVSATLADTPPATLSGVTWTCTATGGTCQASGSGPLNETIDIAVGGSVTFSVTGTVVGSATGSITNTATIVAPAGANDPNPANNSASDTTSIDPKADLSITKTDGNLTDAAGTTVTYTVTVANAGPSMIVGAPVTDTLPPQLSGATWTCTATVGSTCASSSGSGDIATTADILAGGVATYTVTATIDAGFVGTLSNTATVDMPGPGVDPTPANNTATDTTDVIAVVDLSVTKTDGVVSEVPGTPVSYTIVVSNAGPSDVSGASVSDVMPLSLSNVSWTCTGSAGGVCSSSGSGDVVDVVDIASGGSVTYAVSADLAADATGSLVNSVSVSAPVGVTDPDGSNNTATDVDSLAPTADLSVTKTDGVVSEVPGTPVSYTIVVSNAGPSDVSGASVSDVMPLSLSNVSWTCTGSAGGVCSSSGSGDVVDVVDIASGGSVTYAVSADLAADATGSLVNSVSVSAPVGVTDPDGSNNTATDVDSLAPTADLSVTKTDGVVSEVPGTPVSYTIVVSNAGPSNVVAANITDVFPASLLGASWNCVAAGGSCQGSGFGSINTSIDLAQGGTATFTVNGTVASSATGSITNTATVTPSPGTVDPDPSNNSAADVDTLIAVTDLAITKTDNDSNTRPGDAINYQIVVTNNGPSAVTGAAVTDSMPSGLASVNWTCTPGAGAACVSSGSGDLNELVDLAVGASVTFSVDAMVTATAGAITNTAQVDAPVGATDPNTADNVATDSTQVDPVGDLSITKTDGLTSAVPGAATSYTIVITNGGPSPAIGVAVADVLPSTLSGVTWACTATPGSACGASVGSGNISELVDIAAGGNISFDVDATIDDERGWRPGQHRDADCSGGLHRHQPGQ